MAHTGKFKNLSEHFGIAKALCMWRKTQSLDLDPGGVTTHVTQEFHCPI